MPSRLADLSAIALAKEEAYGVARARGDRSVFQHSSGIFLAFLLVFSTCAFALDEEKNPDWDRSLVSLEIKHKKFGYFLPWSRDSESTQKSGVVIGPREILTTAQYLDSLVLVRLQKGGRGMWWDARVVWVDYHANLALITSDEEAFWQGLKSVPFSDPVPSKGPLVLRRWKNGNTESWRAEFSRFSITAPLINEARCLMMELTSNMDNGGWAEVLCDGTKLCGFCVGQEENHFFVLPAPVIQPVLQAHKEHKYKGKGRFAFHWQTCDNPALLKSLHLPGEPRGILVTDVPKLPGMQDTLRLHDIILEVEGLPIDIHGGYQDPHYGYLIFDDLATRTKGAGDSVGFKVWRDGHPLDVAYTLPVADLGSTLVPDDLFDQEPEYIMAGGLVFQPLSKPYLEEWGPQWNISSPFELFRYTVTDPSPEQSSVVILSQVLPDTYNLGYQHYRWLVVDRINGKKITDLESVWNALQKPEGDFHRIEFTKSANFQRLILDANEMGAATQRVLKSYAIQEDHLFRKKSH